MSKLIQEFSVAAQEKGGAEYIAQVRGEPDESGRWHGWIEFVPRDRGPVLRTEYETTQMSLQQLEYWASGLSAPYFQGAVERAEPAKAREPMEPASTQKSARSKRGVSRSW
jgi:hypothetical protein